MFQDPKKLRILIAITSLAAGLVLGSCSAEPPSAPESTPIPGTDISETQPADPTIQLVDADSLFTQWAVSGTASSVFAEPEWGADQAAGEPDAPGCGDYQFAWASAASDSIDQLELNYAVPVIPTQIVIHQSFHPDQVVKVEVYNSQRETYFTVLQKNPEVVDRPCPYQLTIPVTGIDFPVSQIRITVDQSQLGLGWNEIDAVQLSGVVEER